VSACAERRHALPAMVARQRDGQRGRGGRLAAGCRGVLVAVIAARQAAATAMNAATRRVLLVAALAGVRVKSRAPELAMLHAWLDSWSGLGAVVVGDAALRLRPVANPRQERMAGDVPLSKSHPTPVGRASSHLVANAVARRAGGRVAGTAHAVRSGLLARRVDSAVIFADGVASPLRRELEGGAEEDPGEIATS